MFRIGPGCCSDEDEIGFTVTWDPNYPESNNLNNEVQLPGDSDWVEAIGELKSYEILGFPFLYIILTELNILDTRGAEFVLR